ncbi:predicted protein, partial [Haematococcus lacustris]
APAHSACSRVTRCRSVAVTNLISTLADAAERTGTVDAPIEYAVGLGIVVSLAASLAVPLYLKRGQEAADNIFQGKNPNADKMAAAAEAAAARERKKK